jgi:hypothetical protein
MQAWVVAPRCTHKDIAVFDLWLDVYSTLTHKTKHFICLYHVSHCEDSDDEYFEPENDVEEDGDTNDMTRCITCDLCAPMPKARERVFCSDRDLVRQ